MLFLERNNAFEEWTGQAIGEVRHPLNIEDVWTADALAEIGLYKPVRPSVPAGKVVTGETVARVDGVVTYVYDLESVPFKDLNRIQFEFMVEKLNLGTAIETAIGLMPEETEAEQNAKILARVLYRSGQRFERSHYLFTVLAPAVGLTTEQIDAAWTQALLV